MPQVITSGSIRLSSQEIPKDSGSKDGKISRAHNCALVPWKTNLEMVANSLAEYLRKRIETSSQEEIVRRLSRHYIRYDFVVMGDYDQFLGDRAETLTPIMKTLAE